MRIVFIAPLLSLLYAEPILEQWSQKAIRTHPEMERTAYGIQKASAAYDIAGNWNDPSLSLGINDVWLKDLSLHNGEPMQSRSLWIRQKIPSFKSSQAKENVAKAFLTSAHTNHDITAQRIRYEVWQEGINVWESKALQKKIQILKTLRQKREHLEASRPLLRYDQLLEHKSEQLKLTREALALQARYERSVIALRYWFGEGLEEDLLDQLQLKEPHSIETQFYWTKHLKYAPKLKRSFDNRHILASQLIQTQREYFPDITVGIGYFEREPFEDYLSFSLSFSLPLYGTQKGAIEEAKAAYYEADIRYRDTQEQLLAQLTSLYVERLRNYEALQQVHELLSYAKERYRLGVEGIGSGEALDGNLKQYERLTRYEMERITLIAKLYRLYSELVWVSGHPLGE